MPWVLGLATFSAGLAVFCLEENRAQKDYSATTWVAATLTFALGAYAMMGDMRAARGAGGRWEPHSSAARAVPRLGRKIDLARTAVRARATRDDVHRIADHAQRPDWTLRRRKPARGLGHRHRTRGRVVSWDMWQ